MTYRFQWQGVPEANIQSNMPVSVTATTVNLSPIVSQDVFLDDDAGADDLKGFMSTQGWSYILSF